METEREISRRTLQPAIDFGPVKPLPVRNFKRMQPERTIVTTVVDAHKFLTGLRTGRQAPNLLKINSADPEFLPDFPNGRLVIGFTGIHVPGSRGNPFQRRRILARRSPLQKYPALIVRQEDVNRPMQKPMLMYHSSLLLPDDPVIRVHYIKNFCLVVTHPEI